MHCLAEQLAIRNLEDQDVQCYASRWDAWHVGCDAGMWTAVAIQQLRDAPLRKHAVVDETVEY
jgi:hypothetical protein